MDSVRIMHHASIGLLPLHSPPTSIIDVDVIPNPPHTLNPSSQFPLNLQHKFVQLQKEKLTYQTKKVEPRDY